MANLLRSEAKFTWKEETALTRAYQDAINHMPLTIRTGSNQMWSMDFMVDVLTDGRSLPTLNVIDDYNREVVGIELVGIELDFSLAAQRVIRCLEPIDA